MSVSFSTLEILSSSSFLHLQNNFPDFHEAIDNSIKLFCRKRAPEELLKKYPDLEQSEIEAVMNLGDDIFLRNCQSLLEKPYFFDGIYIILFG
jgi:hypothetical protein